VSFGYVTERGIVMNMEGNHLKPSLGLIGMGHMGSHMAHRLLEAGYLLTVYDRTKEKAQEVGQRGAQVAQTPKDLAATCQVVLACVTDDEAQQDVMFGPDGSAQGQHSLTKGIILLTVGGSLHARSFPHDPQALSQEWEVMGSDLPSDGR
jgi:D-arabinose 1-dehydrogenase-like Zn-dependent alcohol dehydrogenase